MKSIDWLVAEHDIIEHCLDMLERSLAGKGHSNEQQLHAHRRSGQGG
jgi:hypothetical protein